MAWDKTLPDGTITSPSAGTAPITSNFSAIETWWGVEHYNPTSTLSGMHKTGIAGFVTSGTYAGMATNVGTKPGTGALYWDNDCGVLRIYRSTNEWKRLTEDHYSRIILKRTASQSIPSRTWTEVTFSGDAVLDTLEEFTSANNALVIKADGYYWMHAHARFTSYSTETSNYEKAVAIVKDDVIYCQDGKYGYYWGDVEVSDVIYCAANAIIAVDVYQGKTSAVNLLKCELYITRLS